jgi:hypothetical protein
MWFDFAHQPGDEGVKLLIIGHWPVALSDLCRATCTERSRGKLL